MKNYKSILSLLFLTLWLLVALVIIFPEASAVTISSTRIQQGQTVHVNDTIDLSGAVLPYPDLAYWDGYGMYDSKPTYTITLPDNPNGWYNFYIDPAIFSTRLGSWYKYNEKIGYETHGNNLVFVVAKQNNTQIIPGKPIQHIPTTVTTLLTLSPPPRTTLVPTQTTIITPTPVPQNFEKGDIAIIVSVTIVGLLFGFFAFYESKFWDRK